MRNRKTTGQKMNFTQPQEVIGLIPAAGKAKRLAAMPCSKELYPVGFYPDGGKKELRPKVVSHYLLEKFKRAGITKAYIVLREGKWDIPTYFLDGAILDMHVAYIVITDSCGPPDTLDRAYPFLGNKSIAFGFPDILFGPDDVFVRLLHHQSATNADVVLGLYPAHDCRAMDMVGFDKSGRVHSMVLKPAQTHLRYAWLCGVWTSTFSQFMHEFLAIARRKKNQGSLVTRTMDAQGDLPVGAVIQAAIRKGVRVDGVPFPRKTYIDIGTPSNLVKAVKRYANAAES